MIVIDGSFGEGGGSLLRQSISMSILTQKPFRIINIRKNRSKPGLNHQHLASIKLARAVCSARVSGDFLGSDSVDFFPSPITSGKDISLDIGSAGSISLALQSVLLPCIFSKKSFGFELVGGTDVSHSPPMDFLNLVLFPLFFDFAKFDFKILRRGFFPKGGGKVRLRISSFSDLSKVKPISLLGYDRGSKFLGNFVFSKDFSDDGVALKFENFVKFYLQDFGLPVNFRSFYSDTLSSGASFFVCFFANAFNDEVFYRVSSNALFDKSLPIDAQAKFLANDISTKVNSGCVVDEFLADMLIPFLAFSKGVFKCFKITDHVLSNIYLVENFLDVKFSVDKVRNEIRVV